MKSYAITVAVFVNAANVDKAQDVVLNALDTPETKAVKNVIILNRAEERDGRYEELAK